MGGLVGILSILSPRECGMCCHQSKVRTIWCSGAMSGANILQTPRKTYPSSDSGNPSRWRLYGSVKDVTYCKNFLKKVNGELHIAVEAVYDVWLIFTSEWSVGLVTGDEIILENSGPLNWSLKAKVTSKGAKGWKDLLKFHHAVGAPNFAEREG